jgi:sugar phosphate isomerase/epimerase
MRTIGFSTGALARGDFRKALRMVAGKGASAIELSALRQAELQPLVEDLATLDLSSFEYVSFHAPSLMEREFETQALQLLEQVARLGWPIVVHPDSMHTIEEWARLGNRLCLENMDKRKPVGQTADHLARFFEILPDASLCFDIGHARQVDPTMSEASAILSRFAGRIQQLHVSEVNSQSKHDRLSFESILAFQRVSHVLPKDVPVILESRVEESEIVEEINRVCEALLPQNELAFTGD